jgi:peroxin-3
MICSIYAVLQAWARSYWRLLLLAAAVVGGGTALYYGFRYLGLTSQAENEREAALLKRKAEEESWRLCGSSVRSLHWISSFV